jgi:hypothetical protein
LVRTSASSELWWGDIEMMIQLFLIERRVNVTILDGQGQVHEGNGFGFFGESPFHAVVGLDTSLEGLPGRIVIGRWDPESKNVINKPFIVYRSLTMSDMAHGGGVQSDLTYILGL